MKLSYKHQPPPPPDPDAILHLLCARCDQIIWAHGDISAECEPCLHAACTAWPQLGPIQGQVSGS